jgi:pimeloyl-ACP methyl ester carboxylesterase
VCMKPITADHPDLVRRLVIHSSAYRLSEPARALQLEVGRLAAERRWRAAWEALLRFTLQPAWLAGPLAPFAALILSLDTPENPSDLLITIAAEDQFNYQDRLAEITAPTLVIAGECDPFYSVELFQATADGIPNARLILYPGLGHPAAGKQFERDVLAFLREV